MHGINFIKNKDESINLIAKEIMEEIKSMKNYGLSQSEDCCFPRIVVNLGSYAEVYSHEVKRDNLILTVSSEIEKDKMAEKITMKECVDPFTGESVKGSK